MATFRVGVGSFNINDGSVGIGTEGSGHGNLKVEGTLKASTNLDVLGVSTFTRYSGFNADNVSVNNRDLTLSGEYSTTGDIVVEDGASLTVGLGSTACVGTVECISVKNHFSVPVGDTAQRNEISGYSEGTIRYNRDLGTMEFFNGNEWRQFRYQADAHNSISNRGRSVYGGGQTPTNIQVIDYISVASGGDAEDFGFLVSGVRHSMGSSSNEIRGLYAGDGPGGSTVIEYITIGSKGDSIDFGDLTVSRRNPSGMSSSTRGVFAAGAPTLVNVIDYVEIMTLGNALDFGDTTSEQGYQAACQSPTRGIIGGVSNATGGASQIQSITIASKGDSVFFGEPLIRRRSYGGASNSVRGIFGGGTGEPSPARFRQTEYITIASDGNGKEFGDLAVEVGSINASATNTKVLFAGGTLASGKSDRIESLTIASTGSAVDFGNLTQARGHACALSDCHGGLGGY